MNLLGTGPVGKSVARVPLSNFSDVLDLDVVGPANDSVVRVPFSLFFSKVKAAFVSFQLRYNSDFGQIGWH